MRPDRPGYWGGTIRVGAQIGLINSGSGHVFLAFAMPEEKALMFEEHQPMPYKVPPPRLDQRLEEVRRLGYEAMESQQTPAVANLSVPMGRCWRS